MRQYLPQRSLLGFDSKAASPTSTSTGGPQAKPQNRISSSSVVHLTTSQTSRQSSASI
ncbi:unnamed protein product, partial [Amoebophrya sp. A120]|eukprot:GSA120T00020729001.1